MYIQAKGHLHEKRAFFGREAIKIVSDFFKGETYINKPKATAKYVKWAIRGNGPALFSKPTPIECMDPNGTDNYIVRSLHHSNVPLTFINNDFRSRRAFLSQRSLFNYLASTLNGAQVRAMTMATLLVPFRWQPQE